MPLFGGSTTVFDADIDKITNERNTSEDWGLIMDLCDQISQRRDGPKEALKSINRRLHHQDPHVVMQAITLLDACVNNCGKSFQLEVASREFEKVFRGLLAKSHPKLQEKLRTMLKKWAEGDFKGDPQLGLIPSLYHNLKREGIDFNSQQPGKRPVNRDPNVVASQQEEEDIAKAIQRSLEEEERKGKGKGNGAVKKSEPAPSSLYGNVNAALANANNGGTKENFKEPKKARALYDFEAAEDNELTFKTGEIVIIVDDSDANWWKGSNHRGEGLFPANFVSTDMDAGKEEKAGRRRSVQFNDEVEVKTLSSEDGAQAAIQAPLAAPTVIDEAKLERVYNMLNDADPCSDENDPPELAAEEEHVNAMGGLVDNELEVVDRRLAQLTHLSTQLVDAMNLYHQLMNPAMQQPAAAAGHMPYMPQQMAPPQAGVYMPYQQAPPMGPPSYGVPPNGNAHPSQVQSSSQQQQPPEYNPALYAAPNSSPMAPPPMQAAQQQQQPHPNQNGYGYPPQQPSMPMAMPMSSHAPTHPGMDSMAGQHPTPPQQALYTAE